MSENLKFLICIALILFTLVSSKIVFKLFDKIDKSKFRALLLGTIGFILLGINIFIFPNILLCIVWIISLASTLFKEIT